MKTSAVSQKMQRKCSWLVFGRVTGELPLGEFPPFVIMVRVRVKGRFRVSVRVKVRVRGNFSGGNSPGFVWK